MFEYKICYHVALAVNAIFYEMQDFALVDLLLKLVSPALISFNIQIEKLLNITYSMVFNINNHYFVSNLSYGNKNIFTFLLGPEIL